MKFITYVAWVSLAIFNKATTDTNISKPHMSGMAVADDGFTTPVSPPDNASVQLDLNSTTPQFWEMKLAGMIIAFGGLTTALIGLVGNILCIIILLRKPPLSSTYMYLVNLAVADLVVCFVGQLLRIFPMGLGRDTAKLHPWFCKTWFFFTHGSTTVSGWTLVAVTIERTLVVYFPLRAKSICTRKTAKIVICAINVILAGVFFHYFWSYGAVYQQVQVGNKTELQVLYPCTIVTDISPAFRYYMLHIRTWQDFVIFSAGPFTCLLSCNILILHKLFVESFKRRSMTSGEQSLEASKMKSLTTMLLSVSFTHLICISPLQIMYLVDSIDPFGTKIEHRWQAWVAVRWAIALDFKYINHAVNFILYCVSGRQFREALVDLFRFLPCCKKGSQEECTVTESSAVSNPQLDDGSETGNKI